MSTSIMHLVISPTGVVRCLYDETLDLQTFGPPVIQRASHVEPDELGQWWADMRISDGPRLGPFARRSEALAAEVAWLEVHWLTGQEADR